MKKIIGLFFIAISALALVACGDKETSGVGYGLVHKHYIGEVTVKMKGKKVVDVQFEEYYLPYNVGSVVADAAWNAEETPDNVIYKKPAREAAQPTYYAKYVLVDGKLYTGSLDATNTIQYLNADNKNIEVIVADEAAAKAYVVAALAGKVFIVDSAEATTKSTVLITSGNAGKGFKKSETGYWVVEGGLGWTGNMKAMADAFVKYGIDAKFTLNDDKLWETVDGVTDATLSDFITYQDVAKRAVANQA